MAPIKHKMPNGRSKINNYWIPGPIRESAHDSQPDHRDPYNPPTRPPMSYFPLTKPPFSQHPPPLPHLTINPPLEGELDHPSGGCIYVPFLLLLLLLLLPDTLDSRPYTGIDFVSPP